MRASFCLTVPGLCREPPPGGMELGRLMYEAAPPTSAIGICHMKIGR